ncbi:Mu transposase C-terminal domain-containing protein [Serratia liquefaciens]|uniref:Mu transposase C-terminal domain-containing protein n=1 Tax=Serratia liquefaciens TaxID=614 RepID=UPI003905E477
MFLTATELMGVAGLPTTTKGMRQALKRFSGDHVDFVRMRKGTHAFEYHIDCLPDAAREVVQARMARQLLADSAGADLPAPIPKSGGVSTGSQASGQALELYRKCPALLDKKLRELTDNQKAVADARMTLVRAVLKLMDVGGMTRKGAIELIANSSKVGELSPEMLEAASIANARKGSTRSGVGVSSLQHWLSDYLAAKTPGEKLAIMAPGKIKAKAVESYPWMSQFLQHWRNPNQPSVTMAYEDFVSEWEVQHAGNELMLAMLPSVDTVRYALRKIPKAERERGRVTGAEYKSMLPFVRRDWSVMPVNGVWIGDGHGMKLEVINPATGKPFMPEITLVIDGCTRVVVGWSLAMSETQVAVGDAIRHAVSQHGLPLIYYSDNGGGEKNKTFDADVTGIFSRLGIDHPTGIPGNPQGRGIIERLNREIPLRVAKTFGSYVGKSGDRETQRKHIKQVGSAVKAIEGGKNLNAIQAAAMQKIPTWEQLIAEIEVQVERHNNRPHESLPRRDGGQHWSPLAYRKHLIAQNNLELQYLSSAELHEMFRPEKICTARRGEIHLFRNIYFSTELCSVEGEKVRVCFDIHDAHSVIVRRMDGTWICDAIWNGNRVDAFPKAYVDQLEENSIKRSVQNLESKVRRKKELLRPAIEQREPLDIGMFAAEKLVRDVEEVHLFDSQAKFAAKKAGNY